jgi:NADH kinase
MYKTALLVWRKKDEGCTQAAVKLEALLREEYGIKVYVGESSNREHLPHCESLEHPAPLEGDQGYRSSATEQHDHIDVGIAIGGDGTLIHLLGYFPLVCPPILGFNGGSLGFLLPFPRQEMAQVVKNCLTGRASILHRARIAVSVVERGSKLNELDTNETPAFHLLNEAVLRRSYTVKGICEIECRVDGRHLALYQGDGVIVATPTGSTAYSMAAGGSIVHPEMQALLLTPLASMTLSSRPLVLPCHSDIVLTPVHGEVGVEMRWGRMLGTEESVWVRQSPFAVPMFTRIDAHADWTRDLSERLRYENLVRNRTDPEEEG